MNRHEQKTLFKVSKNIKNENRDLQPKDEHQETQLKKDNMWVFVLAKIESQQIK